MLKRKFNLVIMTVLVLGTVFLVASNIRLRMENAFLTEQLIYLTEIELDPDNYDIRDSVYYSSHLKNIDLREEVTGFSSNTEDYIVIFTQDGCSHCEKVYGYVGDYFLKDGTKKTEVFFVNISNLKESVYSSLTDENDEWHLEVTPTVMVVGKRKTGVYPGVEKVKEVLEECLKK